MIASRSFHSSAVVFTVVYSVSYLIAVQNNYALFTYHPALEEFGPLVQPPRDGPRRVPLAAEPGGVPPEPLRVRGRRVGLVRFDPQ